MSNDFTIIKRGYNPSEVDEYIENIEKQLNEFKEKSASINKAIINAQIAADNIIKSAQTEAENILYEANTQADEIKNQKLKEILALKLNIQNQKNFIKNFQNDYERLISKYINPLATTDIKVVTTKLEEIEIILDNMSKSEKINDKTQKLDNKIQNNNEINNAKARNVKESKESKESKELRNTLPADIPIPRRRKDRRRETVTATVTTTLTEEEAKALLS